MGTHHAERIATVPPAILAPRRLWTGKQIVTTVQAANFAGGRIRVICIGFAPFTSAYLFFQ